MSIDIAAAEYFVLADARLLDRHRLAVMLHGASSEPVKQSLRAYRNHDGGFGHALEPDIRDPESQTAATLHALEVLAGIGALADPMVDDAIAWIAGTANEDGGVPQVLPAVGNPPRAPWMAGPAPESSFLTFPLAGLASAAGSEHPWLQRGTEWCWARLEQPAGLDGYWIKFAVDFLNRVSDRDRAVAALEVLRAIVPADGHIPILEGTENERLTPLDLADRPDRRSRVLFTDKQIDADLDRLEAGQLGDGGWTVDYLHWSPGQSVEWRGMATLNALATLDAYGRINLPAALRT